MKKLSWRCEIIHPRPHRKEEAGPGKNPKSADDQRPLNYHPRETVARRQATEDGVTSEMEDPIILLQAHPSVESGSSKQEAWGSPTSR